MNLQNQLPHLEQDPFSDSFLTNPYIFYEELREAAPVFYLPKYESFGVARYAEIKQVLGDPETYCSSRGVGLEDFEYVPCWRGEPSRILEVDPPVHTKNRQIMNRVLNISSLQQLKEGWRDKASALIGSLAEQGEFDGVAEIGKVFPLSVFPDAVGIQKEGRENLLPYGNLGFNAFGPDNQLRQKAFLAAKPIMDWVAESCQRDHLLEGGFGRAIYDFVYSGEISEKEAALLVRSLLAAGLDTTVNGISALIYCLASHPKEFQRIKGDPSLIKQTFDEVLRWTSPAQTFFRTTTKDTVLGGIALPADAKILLFLGAGNRDPRQWENGDEFDVGRRPIGHLAFGYGIHVCVGQMIARMEAELILAEMIDKFDTIVLAGKPRYLLNNTLRSFEHIPVRVT